MTDETTVHDGEESPIDAAAADDSSRTDRSAVDDGTTDAEGLDAQGDAAADYIEALLDICDLDGDIDIDVQNGRPYVSVSAEDPEALRLLSKAETVSALQELARLAVQSSTGSFSRLILDIGGSRDARKRELTTLVDRAIDRIEEGAAQAALPPMSSYERKIVHDVVAERGFASHSVGEASERHTVITRA
ncbi:protein jag [Humibacter sp.]|jgi:spoIIIJ-associated protein|uniref:Jag family protein n=1 Tax=Humibacter sp. TaxID=1940291 RepID=UPI002CFE6DED|nr:R3H domain-containing nucleic acid-binding protein [Humibacter sp.]HVX06755.1 R3H domain-containing nucleic acid-binding protein [Humibacter sp.]